MVSDSCNRRVQRFSATGQFVDKWTAPASQRDEFAEPSAIAVDAAGNVYVGASWTHRIWKFAPDGRCLASWTSGPVATEDLDFRVGTCGIAVASTGTVYVCNIENGCLDRFAPDGKLLSSWKRSGAPVAVAVAADETVYVACAPEEGRERIVLFTAEGEQIGEIGTAKGAIEFDGIGGLALGDDGALYVAEPRQSRIQRLVPVTVD